MSRLNLKGGTPPENPNLLRAMKGAAIGDNPNTRGKLYDALLKATFILPTSGVSGEGGISLVMARSEEGNPIMLLFTDEPALMAWQPEARPYVTLSAVETFALAAQHVEKALINPAGPNVSGELTAYELQALAQGLVPGSASAVEVERVLAPSEVRIAEPTEAEELPEITRDHIRTTLARHDNVEAAYLFLMASAEGEPNLVGGVVFGSFDDPDTLDHTMRAIVSAVSPALHGQHMNFMVLHGRLRTAVERTITPLYTNPT